MGASKGATPKPSPAKDAKEATPPPSHPPAGAPSAMAGAAPSGAKGGATGGAAPSGGTLGVAAQIEQAVAAERERWEKVVAASNDAGDATSQQVALRNVLWYRGGLVFKAHRLLYHSTLGLRVIKKKKVALSAAPDVLGVGPIFFRA